MKRITILAGHYGSGKTNIAVNLALKMKRDGFDTVIADLDIVNPYFRTKDSLKELTEAGIKLISSEYANSNVDIPALPQEMYSVVDDKSRYYIVDLGGDDRGAYALGRYADKINEEGNFEMLFVFNMYRPLTPDAESALEVMAEIENAAKVKFTGIVNNSNIGAVTEEESVSRSFAECERLCKLSGLPLKFTSVDKKIYDSIIGDKKDYFPLELQKKIV
ncbi:MAG: hypothetical protein J6A97_06315 [Clostridia bacterium]|nr:hypothetical protein [Clostridia bacterium]